MKTIFFLLGGGLLIMTGVALNCAHARRCHKHADKLRDEGLDETFPASDPPSTQDFSSPEDRGQAPRGYAGA
jgi:hypothetical protein